VSTEIKFTDLKPAWNAIKMATRLSFEVAKGAWWLGQKSTPKPKDDKQIDNSFAEIESIYTRGVFFGKHPEECVSLGRKVNKYIVKPETSDGHVLVVGGVGSGKSSCIAIPTLHSFSNSVFAIDIKGELYEKTRPQREWGRRGRIQYIKRFNPTDKFANCATRS